METLKGGLIYHALTSLEAERKEMAQPEPIPRLTDKQSRDFLQEFDHFALDRAQTQMYSKVFQKLHQKAK